MLVDPRPRPSPWVGPCDAGPGVARTATRPISGPVAFFHVPGVCRYQWPHGPSVLSQQYQSSTFTRQKLRASAR